MSGWAGRMSVGSSFQIVEPRPTDGAGCRGSGGELHLGGLALGGVVDLVELGGGEVEHA